MLIYYNQIKSVKYYNQIKSVLQTLNWLPVEQKIIFKTDLLVLNALQSGLPLCYITQNVLIRLAFLIS